MEGEGGGLGRVRSGGEQRARGRGITRGRGGQCGKLLTAEDVYGIVMDL